MRKSYIRVFADIRFFDFPCNNGLTLFVKSPNGEEKLLTKGMDGANNRMAFRRYVDKYAQECETVKKVVVAIVGKTDVAVEIYCPPLAVGGQTVNGYHLPY